MFFDRRALYIVLAIFVVFSLVSLLSNEGALLTLLLSIPGVLIAITFHEYAHAFAADRLGDDTPRRQGRLSLNPFSHLDPIGSLMLIFAGFGWGKPVEINPRNFNRTMSMEKAQALVSFAGPLMNFILTIVFTIIYCAMYKFAYGFIHTQIGNIIYIMVQLAAQINLGLGIFNLIPLPPLDGSKILGIFLPYNAKVWFENNMNMFYLVFLLLWITGLAGAIISPIISLVDSGITSLVAMMFGI
mgnify:CR=1 FL=1